MDFGLGAVSRGASAIVKKAGGEGLRTNFANAASELEWRTLSASNKRLAEKFAGTTLCPLPSPNTLVPPRTGVTSHNRTLVCPAMGN